MKKRFIAVTMIFTLLTSLVFSGCSKTKDTPNPDTKPTDAKSAANASYEKPKFLTIGTAASGGAYYPIGIVMADIMTNKLGIQTTAQVTGGALENNGLVQNKGADIGITMSSMAYAAYNGKAPYVDKHNDISVLFNNLSSGVFHVLVKKDSAIQSIADLKGKKIAMGPAGGGAINIANDMWSEYGFSVSDIKPTYVQYSDGLDALMDGNVDAAIVQSAAPAPAIKQLAASGKKFRFLTVEEEKKKKIIEKYPYYSETKISKEMYGTDEDSTALYVANMVVINKNLPDGLVYDITKALFENVEKIKESNPAAKDIDIKNADKGLPIPMHPGAKKYFEERKNTK